YARASLRRFSGRWCRRRVRLFGRLAAAGSSPVCRAVASTRDLGGSVFRFWFRLLSLFDPRFTDRCRIYARVVFDVTFVSLGAARLRSGEASVLPVPPP